MSREKGQKALRPFSRGTTSTTKRAKVPFGPFRVAQRGFGPFCVTPVFKKGAKRHFGPLMKFSKMANNVPFDSKFGQNVDC